VGIHFNGETLPALVESVELDQTFHRLVVEVDGVPSAVTLDPRTRLLFEAEFGPH